jgi:signal peptidase
MKAANKVKTQSRSEKSLSDGSQTHVVYTGPSMSPTLKPGDRLQVVPDAGRKVRRGDVIVFSYPKDGPQITHRVMAVDSSGIRTRGDNNTDIDPWLLSPDDILGRVDYAQRGNRKRRVFGGPAGELVALSRRTIRIIDKRTSPLMHPLYSGLARSRFLSRWPRHWIKTRVVSFHRPGGTELQLLLGRHVIGRCLRGETRWRIRRPFRVLVDETRLPVNPSK